MRYIRYCRQCIMPETKPDLLIDEEGVCSACRSFDKREYVDWKKRRQDLLGILDRYRSRDGSNYDCIVPVSGGKDSHYQALRLLELGINPLCVTATTDQLSEIGRRNIENLKRRGVDYIEVTANYSGSVRVEARGISYAQAKAALLAMKGAGNESVPGSDD